MQLFSRRAARSLYKNQRIKRWCFDVELIYLAQELHVPICEVDVEWREVPGRLPSAPARLQPFALHYSQFVSLLSIEEATSKA